MTALKVGDVVAIRTQSGVEVRAVVLFLSKHFKDVMLLGVPAPEVGTQLSLHSLLSALGVLVYTSRASVDAGQWPVVGRVLLPGTSLLTERVVAERVWIEDRPVRNVTDDDRKNVPVMRVAGEGAVEQVLGQIVTREGLSKMGTLLVRESASFLSRMRNASLSRR